MTTTNAITILVMMLITVTSLLPTPSVSLNVSEVMTSQAAGVGSLNIAAGIISVVKIDIELTSQSSFTEITMFIPVDAAFKQLPVSASYTLRSLTVDYKYILMKAHIVRGYYPQTVIRSINLCPTLASENMGTALCLLNISASGGSSAVTISTDVFKTTVNRTVYSQPPFAIYVVSKVLLPVEIFGVSSHVVPPPPTPRHFPSPPLHSGQPTLLCPQMCLVAAISFFLYCF